MKEPATNEQVREMELGVLRALCQGTPEGGLLEAARQTLRGYKFRDPLDQVVFETLLELPALPVVRIREQLAARLTNKGFPDVDLAPYLQPLASARDKPNSPKAGAVQAREWMERLANWAEDRR